jgi:hypothetical protein
MPRRKVKENDPANEGDSRRPPAWRYERVQQLLADIMPPHPARDDAIVRAMRKYYIAKRRLQSFIEDDYVLQQELAGRYRHLWAADRVYYSGRTDRTRYGLEAQILARVEYEDISRDTGMSVEAIDTYEKVFFNVRDRLDQRGYIAGTVLLDAFMSGLSGRTQELTAKYFGYFGGPVVLQLVMNGVDGSIPKPVEPSDTSRWLDHQFRHVFRTSAVIGATFLEPTNYNVRTLFEGYQSLLSLGYREQSSGGDDNVINQALEVFVKQHPIPLGDKADKLPHRPGPLYAGGMVEPRVHEVAAVHSGKSVPALEHYGNQWSLDNTR